MVNLMKHVKYSIVPLVLIILALLFTGTASLPMTSADSNIIGLGHDPDENITSDDDVTIHIQLNSTANVTSVEYQYCEVDPVGVCSIYSAMTHDGDTNYSAVIGNNDGGQTMGYKIKIEYDDGRDNEMSGGGRRGSGDHVPGLHRGRTPPNRQRTQGAQRAPRTGPGSAVALTGAAADGHEWQFCLSCPIVERA